MSSRPAITLICDICGRAIPIDAPTHKAARIKAKDMKWSASVGAYGRYTDFCDVCCFYNKNNFMAWAATPDGQAKTDKFIARLFPDEKRIK